MVVGQGRSDIFRHGGKIVADQVEHGIPDEGGLHGAPAITGIGPGDPVCRKAVNMRGGRVDFFNPA